MIPQHPSSDDGSCGGCVHYKSSLEWYLMTDLCEVRTAQLTKMINNVHFH